MSEKVDLLTAGSAALMDRLHPTWGATGVFTTAAHRAMLELRDEIVRQCNASRTGRALTETEVAAAWDTIAAGPQPRGWTVSWARRTSYERIQLLAFAHRIAALSAPVERGVDPMYKQESEAAWTALGGRGDGWTGGWSALAKRIEVLRTVDLEAAKREAAGKGYAAGWGAALHRAVDFGLIPLCDNAMRDNAMSPNPDAEMVFVVAGEHSEVSRDRYLDATYPPAAPEVVLCVICKQPGADLSTNHLRHHTRDECIEALGVALAASRTEGK